MRVDMNKKLKDVGCSEGTNVTIVAVDGTPLENYFYLPNESNTPATPVQEANQPAKQPNSTSPEDQDTSKLIMEPPESLPLLSGPGLIEEPAVELVTSSKLEKEPAVVLDPAEKLDKCPKEEKSGEMEVQSRSPNESKSQGEAKEEKKSNARASKEKAAKSTSSYKSHDSSGLPERIVESLSAISAVLEGNDELLSRFAQIEEFLSTVYQQLDDCALENQQIYSKMQEIHYENQLLRDMYNRETGKAVDDPQKSPSWMRPNPFRKTDEVLNLPNDVEELKKLVNEKYAVALVNERRYFQQMKQCNKYKAIAQTMNGDEDRINLLWSQYQSLADQRDQLKEENLDLKEKIREAGKDIDEREDKIRQLTETVQIHEQNVKDLEKEVRKLNQMKVDTKTEVPTMVVSPEEKDEKYQSLLQEKRSLEKDLETAKQDNKITMDALERSQISKTNLEKAIQELKEANEKLQSELEESKKAVESQIDSVGQHESKLDELTTKNEDLEKSRLLLQSQLQQMQSEEAKIRENLEQMRNEAEQAQKREEECRKENESLHSLVSELMEKSEEQEQKEDELMKQLDSIMDSIHASLEERKNRSQGLKSRFCKRE